ncbi:SelT/SelW/SelH family protein [archaeon]|nr:MAG: SelT/SelW/SelH family protein [archaeon]
MSKYFQDVKRFVESKYPSVHVSGGLYPPPIHARIFATIMGYVWTIGIVLIVGGQQIFKILGIPEPEFVSWIARNKGNSFLALFVLNTVSHSMLATGAFELYLDEAPVFSKLTYGRVPTAEDILHALADQGLNPI